MTNETYLLLTYNYKRLFYDYCKYQDKGKLKNGRTCEDIFNDKVLLFMELELQTLEELNDVIKGNRKDRQQIITIKYDDEYMNEKIKEKLSIRNNIRLLFIDYRPEK